MSANAGRVPTAAELQAFSLGQLDAQRQREVEAYLAAHPEGLEVVEATPDDDFLQHLRGAGALPRPRPRPWLLQLAVEAVIPVLGGCAGALAGGAAGGLVGVMVGQLAEKAINFFGQGIVGRWLEWLRKQPVNLQVAALTNLADITPEAARAEVMTLLAEQAPHASPEDRQVALDYLSAIPRSVRRSLLSGRNGGKRQLPPKISVADPLSLLQLLPTDVPPYSVPSALPGTDYQLEEIIGSGGFGAVYRASSPSLQYLPLAIKFCLDRSLLAALHLERSNLEQLMKAGGKTWSPRLVRLYGYNLEHRTPFLVYEFVAGGDLVRWLAQREARAGRGLTPGEVLALTVQVAEALAFAHQRGLVHRDLKPANILMADDGTVKLTDFGIGGLAARQAMQMSRIGTVASSRLSPAEQVSLFRGAGTPLYMSLEQKQGAAPDPRQDIYSLGVMWYQLLVGDVTREMAHGWARELEAKFAVPAQHITVIDKCVGWVEDRPGNAGELLPLLRGLQKLEDKEVRAVLPKSNSAGPVPAEVVPPVDAQRSDRVVQLPASPETRHVASPVPLTAESSRFRQIRVGVALEQLLKCHEIVARYSKKDVSLIQGILLGWFPWPIVALFAGLITFEGMRGSYSLDVRTYVAWAVAITSGLPLFFLIVWLRLRFWWKARLRFEQQLSGKIDEMLTTFPQECQAWGGRAALEDWATLKAIFRELAPPKG